jgi:hypothetical protein
MRWVKPVSPQKKRGAFGASLVIIGRNRFCLHRQKRPLCRQHFLKQPPGSAWTRVIPPEFFHQNLFSMDHTIASLDAGLGGEALLSLACHLKTTPDLRIFRAWRTSLSGSGVFLLELPAAG